MHRRGLGTEILRAWTSLETNYSYIRRQSRVPLATLVRNTASSLLSKQLPTWFALDRSHSSTQNLESESYCL
ncbi:hypothetical protein KC320_g9 [Hortaea werneckii]|nr:hypothetical protein KC320_g9 [Hortaea werneckii]